MVPSHVHCYSCISYLTLLLAILLSLCAQTDARIPRRSLANPRIDYKGLKSDLSLPSDHHSKAVIPYQPRYPISTIHSRQTDPFTATVYDWQTIRPSPAAVTAMHTLYTGVLTSLSKLSEQSFTDGTNLHFSYGSLELSISISTININSPPPTKIRSKRRLGPVFISSPRDGIDHAIESLDAAADRGFVGVARVALRIGNLLVIVQILGTLMPPAERGPLRILPNLIP
ncbi:MAG: hypothetical protein Q9216_005214 [Gyalolechia sp. 2 TL-2023]